METKTLNLPIKENAVFKLVVYFLDGNKRSFYNYDKVYDSESKKIIINEKSSLNKLNNLLLHKYSGKYKTAILYHNTDFNNRDTNKVVYKYVNDKLIYIANFNFTWKNFDVLFQFI